MSRSFRPISMIAMLSMVMCMASACGETGGDESYGPYLKAASAGRGDSFGASVAWFGDTLVVGAPGEASAADGVDGDQSDDSAEQAGAVYVFQRSEPPDGGEPEWMQTAYLKASNSGAGDLFGASVAINGDRIAVGAYGEASASGGVDGDQSDDSLLASGAVYLFERDEASWKQVAYIKPEVTRAGDQFGFSVALWSTTLVVGSPREDGTSTGVGGDPNACCVGDAGAVYVFQQIEGTWQQTAYIKSPNPDTGHFFGHSVALYQDTLAVGAPNLDGSVYVYERSGLTWLESVRFEGFDAGPLDSFGASVSLFGPNTLAVGAPEGDGGAAYVFQRAAAGWVLDARIKASNSGDDDDFGQAVAINGSYLAVSATGEDSAAAGVDGDQRDDSAPESGAVYLFARRDMQWEQDVYLKALNTDRDDRFGASVALVDDTAAIGAPGEDGNFLSSDPAGDSGAVYLFRYRQLPRNR
jgi:hypothetical protein